MSEFNQKTKTTKEQVLDRLLEAKNPVSGGQLAKELCISRNAIWKAIEQLREEGFEIEAKSRQGYRLISQDNRLVEAVILKELLPITDYRLRIYPEIGSTNDEGKLLAQKGEAENLVILAESQTAGKGRRGRSFYSQGSEGIYMSILLRPELPFNEALKITTMTAVAVARAIEKNCPVNVGIKWVNDLFINGKKVCGILTEAGLDFETGQLDYAVVGIGINVLKRQFPEELQDIVTTLEDESGIRISRSQLVADILKEVDTLYRELGEKNNTFYEEYVSRSVVVGKEVTVLEGNTSYEAKVIGIDENIGLVVETKEGTKTLSSGEVSVRQIETRAHESFRNPL